jgi:hypothetical protein
MLRQVTRYLAHTRQPKWSSIEMEQFAAIAVPSCGIVAHDNRQAGFLQLNAQQQFYDDEFNGRTSGRAPRAVAQQ